MSLSARLKALMDAEASRRPLVEPNYVSQPPACNRTLERSDFGWVQALRERQAADFKATFRAGLQSMLTGTRIRNLRRLLGWTQRRLAVELNISVRTIIRHEQGKNCQQWTQPEWLWRLSQLEADFEDELIALSSRIGP
jgi:DNA-binding XRE family transcriptional regulator